MFNRVRHGRVTTRRLLYYYSLYYRVLNGEYQHIELLQLAIVSFVDLLPMALLVFVAWQIRISGLSRLLETTPHSLLPPLFFETLWIKNLYSWASVILILSKITRFSLLPFFRPWDDSNELILRRRLERISLKIGKCWSEGLDEHTLCVIGFRG